MFAEEVLKLPTNAVVEGTYLINDIKLRPFNEKEGHFLTFTLQDKTGILWSKIWDNAEYLAQQLKEQDASIVTIKGRTNLYNNKVQVIVDKIKKADTYNMKDLVKLASRDPEDMWGDLQNLWSFFEVKNKNIVKLWEFYSSNDEFLSKFKKWPGGKGTVHHAYQHGLLEHTLSVIQLVKSFKDRLSLPIDFEKAIMGAFLHDIGKIDSYSFDIGTKMTNIGRLHEHTVLGYFRFRRDVEFLEIKDDELIEEIGHIILSHHGSKEMHAVVKPMTIEAKLVSYADNFDAETNYMSQQLEYNTDDFGWVFDSLNEQFYFKRPITTNPVTIKRKKIQHV